MDADGALVEFGEVHDFVDGLHGIDEGWVGGVELVDVGGSDGAIAGGGIEFFDAVVADAEAADGSGHPAVLTAMVVDAAVLAAFPAEGHALEESVFEDQIAGVAALGKENVGFEAGGLDGMMDDVVLDGFEGEVFFGDGGEAGDPVGDGDLRGGDILRHR